MQGTEATFDDLSFEGGDSPRRVLQKVLPGVAAVALAGAVGVWALHWRESGRSRRRLLPAGRQSAGDAAVSKPFGDIVIDADLLAELKRAAPAAPSQQVASLETAPPASFAPIPLPSLEAFPPAPPTPPAESAPAAADARWCPKSARRNASPCRRLVRRSSARPRSPAPPERHAPDRCGCRSPRRAGSTIATSSRNCSGWAHPSSPVVASASAGAAPRAGRLRAPQRSPALPRRRKIAAALGRGPLFSASRRRSEVRPRFPAMTAIPPSMTSPPASSICRTEHGSKPIRVSGEALDNPRYVSRARGWPDAAACLRADVAGRSFHGVQALRLNPVGEGGIYGRAGLLAHPFMLGPNGDSNGCVSVKDYDAFLRGLSERADQEARGRRQALT